MAPVPRERARDEFRGEPAADPPARGERSELPPRAPGGAGWAGLPPDAVDALALAVFAVEADGRLRGASRKFLDLVGVGDEAALEGTLLGLFSDPAQLARWVETARSHGEATAKATLQAAGGRQVEVWLNLHAIPGDDGLVGVVKPLRTAPRRAPGGHRDEDVEHALHRTEEWSRAIEAAADEVGLGVAISVLGEGREPRLVFVNAAGAHILGRAREELVHGRAFPEFTPDLEARLRLSAASASLGRLVVQTTRPDGSAAQLQLGFSLGDYWGRPAVFAFFRDITREQALEASERSAREQLVHSLEETARLKTELLNVAAHELSNPLTPIAMQVEMLKEGLARGAGERERAALDMLERNVKRLSRLLGDLLEVARMQAGRLTLSRKPVDVARLAQDVVETYADTARRLGVELVQEVAAPVGVDADPDRVSQVVANLVSNALKFTPRGGRVAVAVSVAGGEAVVRVSDTGAGLHQEDIARLFQPFGQLQGKEKGGTGLGLFISKGIVEQHGGRIWVESAGPGKGSTFAFALPVRRPEEASPSAGSASEAASLSTGARP